MAEKIKVVMCPADRAPYITNISNTLENLQRIVGGYIETVPITYAGDRIVICDEEGRLRNKPKNTSFLEPGYVGDVILAATDGEELVSLPDEEARYQLHCCKQRFKYLHKEAPTDGK